MTNSETIKILNTVLFFGKCDLPNEHAKECLKTAIQALEKQIPKKPSKCLSFTTSLFICPTCGRKQPIMYEQYYCKECGQKLDWSDEE